MITRQRLSRGYERPADREAVAAASAIGRTLSMNGKGVGENHFSSASNGALLGDARRTVSVTGSRINSSRAPSMTRTRSIMRSESMQSTRKQYTRNSSLMSHQGEVYEDAQSAFNEFGGPQAKGVIHRSPSTQQSKPRTIRKYVPSYKGLIAVDVPVEVASPAPQQRTRTITRPTSSRSGSMTRTTSQENLPRSQSRSSSMTSGRTSSLTGNRTASFTGGRASTMTSHKSRLHSQPRYSSLTNASLANVPRREHFMSTTLEEEEEEVKPLVIKRSEEPRRHIRIVRREEPSRPTAAGTVKTVKTVRRTALSPATAPTTARAPTERYSATKTPGMAAQSRAPVRSSVISHAHASAPEPEPEPVRALARAPARTVARAHAAERTSAPEPRRAPTVVYRPASGPARAPAAVYAPARAVARAPAAERASAPEPRRAPTAIYPPAPEPAGSSSTAVYTPAPEPARAPAGVYSSAPEPVRTPAAIYPPAPEPARVSASVYSPARKPATAPSGEHSPANIPSPVPVAPPAPSFDMPQGPEPKEMLDQDEEPEEVQQEEVEQGQEQEQEHEQSFEVTDAQVWDNKLEEEIKQSLENEQIRQPVLPQHPSQDDTIEEEPEREEEEEENENENEIEIENENENQEKQQVLQEQEEKAQISSQEQYFPEQLEKIAPVPAIQVNDQTPGNYSPVREPPQARLRDYLEGADSYVEKFDSEEGSFNGGLNVSDGLSPLKMSSGDSQGTEASDANVSTNSIQEDKLAREVRDKLDDMGQGSTSSNSEENSDDLFVDSREDISEDVDSHGSGYGYHNPYLSNKNGGHLSRGLTKQPSPIKSALKKTNTGTSNTSSVYSDVSPANQAYLSLTTAENTRLNAQLTSNESIPRKPSYKHLNRSRSLLNHNKSNQSLSSPPKEANRPKRHSHQVGVRSHNSPQYANRPTTVRPKTPMAAGNQPQRNELVGAAAKSQVNNPLLYPREPPPRRSSFEKNRNKDTSIGLTKQSLRSGGSVEDNYQQSTLDSHFRGTTKPPPVAPPSSNEPVNPNGMASAGFKSRFQDSDSEEEGAPFSNGSKSTQPSSASTDDSANNGNGFSLFKHKEEPDGFAKKWGKLSMRSSSGGEPANQQGYSTAKRFGSAPYETQNYESKPRTLRDAIPREDEFDEAGGKKNVFGKKLKKLFGKYK